MQTGELMRSLDDEKAKLADKETPENWKSLRRAIGSVGSLAFSPDGLMLAMCGGSFADFLRAFWRRRPDGLSSHGSRPAEVVGRAHRRSNMIWPGITIMRTRLLFRPDGKFWQRRAVDGRKAKCSGTAYFCGNAQTGDEIHNLIRTTADGGARAIAFSPDSKLLAMGTRRSGDDATERSRRGRREPGPRFVGHRGMAGHGAWLGGSAGILAGRQRASW